MDLGRTKFNLSGVVGNVTTQQAAQESLSELDRVFFTLQRDVQASPGLVSFPCSVAVTKGKALNIAAGAFRLADRTLNRPCQAISLSDGSSTKPAVAMLLQGYVSGLSGLVADTVYYLDVTGNIVTVKPGAGLIQAVGYSLSTTEFLVNIAQP